MSPFLIYGLKDPRTDAIRYIGQSSRGLVRPKLHLEPQRCVDDRNGHKRNWIEQLRGAGLRPEIVVLETLNSADDLNPIECFWIAQARGLDWPLTNLTKGGEGQRGFKRSPASIQKQVATRAARNGGRNFAPTSDETREKLRAANSGKPWSLARRTAQAARAGVKMPPRSAETAAKMRAAKLGRKHSAETRAKMSATHKALALSKTGRKS